MDYQCPKMLAEQNANYTKQTKIASSAWDAARPSCHVTDHRVIITFIPISDVQVKHKVISCHNAHQGLIQQEARASYTKMICTSVNDTFLVYFLSQMYFQDKVVKPLIQETLTFVSF